MAPSLQTELVESKDQHASLVSGEPRQYRELRFLLRCLPDSPRRLKA
jgi:hypothetical protein